MSFKYRVRNAIFFIEMTFIGIISVLILGISLSKAFSIVEISQAGFEGVVFTWLAMITGFCIIPYTIMKRKYGVDIKELGLATPGKYEIATIVLSFGLTIIYLLFNRSNMGIGVFTIVLLQNMGVAISEEFFSKGVLYYIASRITETKIPVVFICSLVFAFMFHSQDPLMVNLTYRLPMGFILGICYIKTNNLYLPICFHVINNLIATSLLK